MSLLAARGTVLIAAVLGAGLFLRPRGEAVGDVVELRGERVSAGWYDLTALGIAVAHAGGPPSVLQVGTAGDGDRVDVVGAWAVVDESPAPAKLLAGTVAAGRVSLNHASLAELEALPRVGPVLAARIVAGRPYRSVGELDRVKGVGPATLAKLRPLVAP